MATDYATATAAPIHVKALGRTWDLSPLTFRSWGELEQWMRTITVRFARDAADGCSKPERDEIYQAAIRQAQMISFVHAQEAVSDKVVIAQTKLLDDVKVQVESGRFDEEGIREALGEFETLIQAHIGSQSPEAKVVQSLLSSPAGLLKIFHLSLTVRHRGLTEDRATQIALDMEDDLGEVATAIMEMSQRSTDRGDKGKDKEEGESSDPPKESP